VLLMLHKQNDSTRRSMLLIEFHMPPA